MLLFNSYEFAWREHSLGFVETFHNDSDSRFLRYRDANNREWQTQFDHEFWQLDAHIVLWHDWLLQLGLRPLVKVVGLQGREINGMPPSGLYHSFLEDEELGTWSFRHMQRWAAYLPGVRSAYGTAVFAPADGKRYSVFIKGAGLVIEENSGVGEEM